MDKHNVVPELLHHIILDARQRLTVSGALDVESFDENTIVMQTSKGGLMVRGTGLRVDKLNLEGGEVNIEGRIDSLQYEDEMAPRGGGLFARMFR